jgi:hypothetical protein
MPEHRDTDTMVDRLIALNREAFEAGNSTTASHILAAALHEAHDHHVARLLFRVQHVAKAQLAWIDSFAPTHEHATPSAEARGQTSSFAMLATQAHTTFLLRQQERTRVVPLPPHPDQEQHSA